MNSGDRASVVVESAERYGTSTGSNDATVIDGLCGTVGQSRDVGAP